MGWEMDDSLTLEERLDIRLDVLTSRIRYAQNQEQDALAKLEGAKLAYEDAVSKTDEAILARKRFMRGVDTSNDKV